MDQSLRAGTHIFLSNVLFISYAMVINETPDLLDLQHKYMKLSGCLTKRNRANIDVYIIQIKHIIQLYLRKTIVFISIDISMYFNKP